MTESDPLIGIAIVLAAALVGGMIAHRLRQPVILGYLIVGVAIGPYGFGVVQDVELIEDLAVIGVALLMFTVGLEISFRQLQQTGRVGVWGGITQIVATLILGTLAGTLLFRWPLDQAAFFGLIISLSSTMVCFKMLIERGELDSMHGRIMIAILIVQDLSVILMMIGVPIFGASIEGLPLAFAVAAGKAVLFIAIAVALGIWVLPWLLGRVAGVRSRELFLLTVLILCFGAAFATQIFGLSIAFGAFIIGLFLRESIFVHQALAEITPLRDVFATLFFVSLGMLLQPQFVIANWPMVVGAVATVMAIKFAVCFGVTKLFGYSGRTAILVGAGLVQTGEFGFILATAGLDAGIIPENFNTLIIAVTIITMLLTPLLLALASTLRTKRVHEPVYGSMIYPEASVLEDTLTLRHAREVVICGYGRVGRNIVRSLHELDIPFLVIEADPEVAAELRGEGYSCIYGDASNTQVLSLAELEKVKILVVTYPDPMKTIKAALTINPKLKAITRIQSKRESEQLQQLGVKDLISPEYEASFEFTSRTLARIGWDKKKVREAMYKLWGDEETRLFGDVDTD